MFCRAIKQTIERDQDFSLQKNVVSDELNSVNLTQKQQNANILDKLRADKGCDYLSQYSTASIKLTESHIKSSIFASVNPTNAIVTIRTTDEAESDVSRDQSNMANRIEIPLTAETSQSSKIELSSSKFEEKEILGLKLMFSLFDRSGQNVITYEDLVAYAEETQDLAAIRDAGIALDIVDIDGDGRIGLVDFIRFATRLKNSWNKQQYRPLEM